MILCKNQLIFTTYHSLHKIQNAHSVLIDTIYFDESHNAVQKNFIEAVEYYSMYATRCYFFTATPKHSNTPMKVGMNENNPICTRYLLIGYSIFFSLFFIIFWQKILTL